VYNVYQHWDKLKVCVVGKTYPPEFYSFIKNPKLRNLFEKIASETEEDLQNLTSILHKFDVKTIRPNVPSVDIISHIKNGETIPPPISMVPRDQMIMIGDKFFFFPYDYITKKALKTKVDESLTFYEDVENLKQFQNKINCWEPIFNELQSVGNTIIDKSDDNILSYLTVNGIMRCGKDLYFGLYNDKTLINASKILVKKYLKNHRSHNVPLEGHLDGWFMPIVPGLLLSAYKDVKYDVTFPNWETVYIPEDQSRFATKRWWRKLKAKNKGKWWIKDYEHDDELISFVETWLTDWVGYVEETVFDVNVLMIDEKNVICNNYNKVVFDAFERYGVTPHICNLRHRFFWDGGLHCCTLDLHREGTMVDYFPSRDGSSINS
jgi:hypothetical protein